VKLGKKELVQLYTNMVRARRAEEKVVKCLQEGKVASFYHSGQGSEAVGVGACTFLKKDDYIYPHHRGHGLAYTLSKGSSLRAFMAEHFGRATGMAQGVAGFHGVDVEHGLFGGAGTIGSQFPVSVGWALGAKKNNRGQVVLGCFGDGSSNRGTLHEAMNLAAVWKLPIVWICENNLYAQWMPIKDAYPREDIADLAHGYNMPGVVVDGQDVIAVHEAVSAAVERARKGEGPSLIECKTYRYRAHSEGSADIAHVDPRPAAEVEAWKKRDPIKLFQEKLLKEGILTEADVERIDKEAQAEADEAEKFALDSPRPEPSILPGLLYAEK
jgi:pyruvate dehydrogenase E1 component alpha subunit